MIRSQYGPILIGMTIMPISAAKARFNEVVDQTSSTHDHVTITKNGMPAVVMVSATEWESIQETLYWMSEPGAAEDVAEGRRAYERGETLSEAEVRARIHR